MSKRKQADAPIGGDEIPGTTDAIEIAMDEERHDPAPDSPARTLLVRQGRLLELQIRRERLMVWTQGLIVALIMVAVAGLGLAAWRASQDRGIVVQAFTTPESLSAKGLTGEAAALRLLDGLSSVRETISSSTFLATNKIQGGGDGLKIEIPQTGLTVDDVYRLMVRWLGKQTIISGQIVDNGDGRVTIMVRSSRHGVSQVTGPASDVDALFQQLAEAVFAKAEPTNWVQYLEKTGRSQEAYDMALRLTREPGLSDLPPPYNVGLLGDQEPDPVRSLQYISLSLRDEPNFMASWIVALRRRTMLGHDEMVLADARKVLSLRERDQEPRFQGVGVERMRAEALYNERFLLGDYRPEPELYASHRATLLALAHDASAARDVLNEATLTGRIDADYAQRVQARIALARNDGAAALRSLDALDATLAAFDTLPLREPPGPVSARRQAAFALARLTTDTPLRVRALIAQGRAQEAQSLAARTPLDCHACVVARAEAASALNQWTAADRWFTRARTLAPSLPWADLAEGRSLLARGDLDSAERALARAKTLAPRLAEVRYEQALLAQRRGDEAAAIRAFKAAAARAPHWGRLHMAWGEAEAKRGRRDAARALWTQAQSMDLSPADRDRLAALLSKA